MREQIDFTSYPVACPICGERVLKIDADHAKKHGYKTLASFRKAHGYTTLLQRTRRKLQSLYNYDRFRWCTDYLDSSGNYRYVTKQYVRDYEEAKAAGSRSASRYALSDAVFNRHLNGKAMLAIFPSGTHSRWFGFDIDTKENAPIHTLKLLSVLQAEGIPEQHIHVSYSGSKGYHIELYTDKHINFVDWTLFARYIRDRAGLTGEAIEWRPTSTNGHAWKLPLTLHYKTGGFAGFCDRATLEVMGLLASHDYLFKIEPMDAALLWSIFERARQHESDIIQREQAEKLLKQEEKREQGQAIRITDNRIFPTKEEKEQTAQRLWDEGLVAVGTRMKATVTLALFLFHEQGLDTESIREMLIEWTEKQIERGMALTPIDRCIQEIDELLPWVETQTDGFYSTVREISVTRGEIEWVVANKPRYARDLLFALLLRSKAYANRQGYFYSSTRDIQKLLSKPREINRGTIRKWRIWLEENGYIETIIPDNSFKTRKAMTFRLLYEEKAAPEVMDSVTFERDMDCRDLLRQIAGKLYSESQLKLLNF